MVTLRVLNGCRTVQLTRGFSTLIDECDLPKLGGYSWNAKRFTSGIYAARNEHASKGSKNRKYRTLLLHRVLMDAPPGMEVDHRDGDKLNNTRSNIRLATHTQNQQNRRRCRGGSSRFKGVLIHSNRYIEAYIGVEGKNLYIGSYSTEEEAARAYDAAAIEFFGEFAATNADLFGEY
jgi:hypothetical protein